MYMLEHFILLAIQLYSYLLIVYILMSWFPNARESSFGQVIGSLAEPYLDPFRKIIPPIGMLDISPIVAFLVLRLFVIRGVQFIFQLFT